MMVKISFLGPIKQAIGTAEIVAEMPPLSTLGELLNKVIADHPKIGFNNPREIEDYYMFIVGKHVANLNCILGDKEDVILFPFVEGG